MLHFGVDAACCILVMLYFGAADECCMLHVGVGAACYILVLMHFGAGAFRWCYILLMMMYEV